MFLENSMRGTNKTIVFQLYHAHPVCQIRPLCCPVESIEVTTSLSDIRIDLFENSNSQFEEKKGLGEAF
ncbi:hypothetical protein [Methylicorpusculum sp.]|uniref:hypothetical protein n=1 Tax=Methylicorpusculum sp. TaxID=2713644 RepID=UPI00272FA1B1|nr:hypothetical protein [Methylicorpusculum sp.]